MRNNAAIRFFPGVNVKFSHLPGIGEFSRTDDHGYAHQIGHFVKSYHAWRVEGAALRCQISLVVRRTIRVRGGGRVTMPPSSCLAHQPSGTSFDRQDIPFLRPGASSTRAATPLGRRQASARSLDPDRPALMEVVKQPGRHSRPGMNRHGNVSVSRITPKRLQTLTHTVCESVLAFQPNTYRRLALSYFPVCPVAPRRNSAD